MNLILPLHIHSKTSVLTFFFLHVWAECAWMSITEQVHNICELLLKKTGLLTSTLQRKPEYNFRRSFIRWLLPAQSRRRLCKGHCDTAGDSCALDSIHHGSSPHSLSVEEGFFNFLAMWKSCWVNHWGLCSQPFTEVQEKCRLWE